MATTPMIGPDGTIADVPHGSVQRAILGGARIAFDMVSPDGQRAAVPLESMHAAIAAGAQLAPSSAGAFAAASVPKPPNSLQGVAGYDALGPIPDTFGTRVGNRIQQNLESLANIPAEFARETQQAATGPHSVHALVSNTANAVYGMLQKTWQDWHDPAKVAGDVLTGYMTGAATEGAEPAATAARTATTAAPAELSLVPKLTKAYDTLQAIGGGAHAPELTQVLDGLNELSQRVVERIQQPESAPPAGNTLSSLLQDTPKAVRSFADVREDQSIQQAMDNDLAQHGASAYAEQAREFAARNSMDVPKWQRILNQKIDQLIQDAEQKQTTSPAVKPYKAKAAAAAVGSGSDDLTDILKASLDVARKKKGVK